MPHRLCTIKLTAAERDAVRACGKVTADRPVEWPLAYRVPFFEQAYVDPGGTDIWGPGPYLKVPCQDPRDGERYIDRVFCPWGYPPQRVRVMRTRMFLRIVNVSLTQRGSDNWAWVLTLEA
jgi:hypothetical protein